MPADFKAFSSKDFVDFDIKIFNYGYRRCAPGFAPGYHKHQHHVIHYIYEGECAVRIENKSYTLRRGQMFFVQSGVLFGCKSSETDPCTYRWVEFDGENINSFIKESRLSEPFSVFDDDNDMRIGNLMMQMTDEGKMSVKKLNAYAWFLAEALSPQSSQRKGVYEKYVERAIEYIRFNSEKKTTVTDVAAYLQIDRSYLSRVFNEYMGISIKKYIYNYHMDIGKSFLMYSDLSIKEIASAIGYEDPLDFTKAFHRTYGMSPTKWRNLHSASDITSDSDIKTEE